MSLHGTVAAVIFLVFFSELGATWTLTGSSDFAVAGESFTLTCNPHDSNDKGVNWRRLDIDTSGTFRATVSSNGCSIDLKYDPQYNYSCEPGPVYKLTIPANVMTNSQNNKEWRCESVFGGMGNSAAAEYKVKVQVPVSSISVQADNAGNQQVNVIYENIPKTFYCITNGCRPKANVTVTTTGVTKGQLTASTIPQNGDLIITSVLQVITTNRGGSTAKTLQCSAVNIQGRQPITSQLVTLDVYYIPTVEPTLTGYSNGTVLYEGDSDLTLTCQQAGGYPLSVITWSCEGQTGTTNNGQKVASSYVRLTVNRNLNRKTCTCIVRHTDSNLAYTRTLSVIFTVYYSPSTPSLQTSDTSFPWVENTQGVLRCITTPGYPSETTYDWLQDSQVINGQTTDTYTISTLTNVHNGLHIQCRVSNLYTIQRPPAKESNILTLDVQYTPIITLDTTSITVQEGDNPSGIPCSAIGNPTPTVKWYRGNSEQTSGTGTSATLVFINIDRNQADNYQCKATATGKLNFESSKSVSVVVYYPPAVTVDLQNTTETATNAVFTCNADGFSTNYTYHGWTQYIGNTLVRSYTDFTGMLTESNRKLTLPRVTFEDTGTYHCDVENGFHGRKPDVLQQGSSYFDVRASAKFDPKEEARKPGELHENLTINITFYSNPQPVLMSGIKWINKTSRNPLTSSDSVSLNLMSTFIQRIVYGKPVTLTGQTAMLTIASLQSFHLGYYQLQIQNGGNLSSSFDFQIITSAPPETPSEFSLAENGTKSVKVTWKRGFNGGHTQTFVIRFTNTGTLEMKETTIEDTNQNSNYKKEIDELKPSTTYHFWIYSTNEKGNSTLSDTLIVQTLKAKPDPPKYLVVYDNKLDSIFLTWERGYDGGYHQTFVILVQNVESKSVRKMLVSDDAKSNNLSTRIDGLLPSITYQVKIYAMNENGNSSLLSLIFVKETITGSVSQSISGKGPITATSVIIVILCVVIILLAIIIWRRGHCISIKGNGSKHGEKVEVGSNYEGVSQNHLETNLYERIQPDQENRSDSRAVDTYESLESRAGVDVKTENTYQSLQITDRPDTGGIAMELYENTKITS